MGNEIQVSELSYYTNDNEPVLQNVSFGLDEGEIGYITGLSQSQQSALINVLLGDEEPDNGQILMVDRNIVSISKQKTLAMRKSDVGFAPSSIQTSSRSVVETLRFKLKALGETYDLETKIEGALQDSQLAGKQDLHTCDLDRLEQAQLSLALALVNRPELLLVEHPSIDSSTEQEQHYLQLLQETNNNRGITILGITSTPGSHFEGIKQIDISKPPNSSAINVQ